MTNLHDDVFPDFEGRHMRSAHCSSAHRGSLVGRGRGRQRCRDGKKGTGLVGMLTGERRSGAHGVGTFLGDGEIRQPCR